jgi:hypothetical protein
MSHYWSKRQYSEDSTHSEDLAKRGMVYLLHEFFTIAGATTITFAMQTHTAPAEFAFYDIASSAEVVKAEMIENPTVTLGASSIQGHNLNRTASDTYNVTFHTATSVSSGTVIASELIGSGSKAGGTISSQKVHTLKPDATYVMRFQNLGNQSTILHLNLGWTENAPGHFGLVTQV